MSAIAVAPVGASRSSGTAHPQVRRAVVVLELLLGVSALAGAAGLISGSLTLGDALDDLPFHSEVFAGVCLGVVNGFVPLVAAVSEWRRASWAPWAHVVAGVGLMGWIVVQIGFLGLVSAMQPALFAWGAAIAVLGAMLIPRRGSSANVPPSGSSANVIG